LASANLDFLYYFPGLLGILASIVEYVIASTYFNNLTKGREGLEVLFALLVFLLPFLGLALRAVLNLNYLLINPREALNEFTDAIWLLIVAIDFIADICLLGKETYDFLTTGTGIQSLSFYFVYAALQIIPTGSYIVAIIAYIFSQNDDVVTV
jgi:hypothetical protein